MSTTVHYGMIAGYVAAEHQTVRTAAGAFDLCHMGRLHLSGPRSPSFLERQVCRPTGDMTPGQVRYGMVLAEDGTVAKTYPRAPLDGKGHAEAVYADVKELFGG